MLDHLSDEELAARAQAGARNVEGALVDPNAIEASEKLIRRYWDKAGIIARTFRIPGVEHEDKESECLKALAKAIDQYKVGKGTKFLTFAKMLMTRALIEVWRDVNAAGEIPVRKIVSLDQPVDGGDEAVSFEDMVASSDDTEREVLDRICAGESLCGVTRDQHVVFMEATQRTDPWSDLTESVALFARSVLPAEMYADIIDVLRSDDRQPKLIELAPSKGSDEATALAQSVFGRYIETQWDVICALAEGHSHAEIALRYGLPIDVVKRMVRACKAPQAMAA